MQPKWLSIQPASALLAVTLRNKGQQIWCKSRADGNSPDDRERQTCPLIRQTQPSAEIMLTKDHGQQQSLTLLGAVLACTFALIQ